MYRSTNRRSSVAEPEVWFRIVHITLDGANGAPVAAYREQTVEIALGPKGAFENEPSCLDPAVHIVHIVRMTPRSRGIRVSEPLAAEIQREAARRAKSWSATAAELLEEAVRMRRAPGVVFVDGASGRRAVVAGSGLDVWEIIATWRAAGEDYEELQANYPWLSDVQLRAALGYYELYPAEVDARLARETDWTPQRVREEFPFTTRPGRAS